MDTKELSASEVPAAVLAAEDRLTAAKTPVNPVAAKEAAVVDSWADDSTQVAATTKKLSPVLALKAGATAAAESAAQGHDEQSALKAAAATVENLEVASKSASPAKAEPVSGAVLKAGEQAVATAEAASMSDVGGNPLSGMLSMAKNAYSTSKEIVGDFISGVKEVSADPEGAARAAGNELVDEYKTLKELPSSVMAEISSIGNTMRQQMNSSHEAATHAEQMAPASSPVAVTRSSGGASIV